MIRHRPPSRVISDERVKRLIIHKQGEKALQAGDLMALFGMPLDEFYRRIGGKLWYLPRSCMFTVTSAGRTAPAFTQGGVAAICALLDDARIQEMGIEIARLMKQRKRASANREAPARRADSVYKAERYRSGIRRMVELQAALNWPAR